MKTNKIGLLALRMAELYDDMLEFFYSQTPRIAQIKIRYASEWVCVS